MSHEIEISVYQHPLYEEGTVLFQTEPLPHLLAECEQLFLKSNSISNYPKEEVELRFTKLFETVSLAKSICIKLMDGETSWEPLLANIGRYYPQLVWTQGKEVKTESTEYWFEFIPLVFNHSGFPFGTSLNQTLAQQGVEAEEIDLVNVWIQDLETIVTDFLKISASSDVLLIEEPVNSQEIAESGVEPTSSLTSEVVVSVLEGEAVKKPKKGKGRKKTGHKGLPLAQDTDLERENRQLAEKVAELTAEIQELQTQSLALTSSPGQKLYYEEALRRESEEKERMQATNAKLESLVNRLELQAQTTSAFDLIESDFSYSERNEDWYKKRTIDLIEYDQLYRKARYLEHTWQVNQQLTVTTERMTINESKLTYERERFNRLKNSAKDVELFVMMDECKMINDRVKVRQGFLWMKPQVKIMNGDYENLVEKANYFDIIHSENKLLEKIIEENDGDYRRKSK